MGIVDNSIATLDPAHKHDNIGIRYSLLGIPCEERQVEDSRNPIAINDEEESKKSMYCGFWDNIGIQTVAELDRIYVVTSSS